MLGTVGTALSMIGHSYDSEAFSAYKTDTGFHHMLRRLGHIDEATMAALSGSSPAGTEASMQPRSVVASVRAPKFEDVHEDVPLSDWTKFDADAELSQDDIIKKLSWSQIWQPLPDGASVESRFVGIGGADLYDLLDVLYLLDSPNVALWDQAGIPL